MKNNFKTRLCVSIARNYEKFWHHFGMSLIPFIVVLIFIACTILLKIPFNTNVFAICFILSLLGGLMFSNFCYNCYHANYKAEKYGMDFWTAWNTAIPGEEWDF